MANQRQLVAPRGLVKGVVWSVAAPKGSCRMATVVS